MADEDPVFGDVIYSYTRKQAIEDGVLVDITEMAKEAGIKYPAVRRPLYPCGRWQRPQ
jgi:type I site-specific restriction endonuclease